MTTLKMIDSVFIKKRLFQMILQVESYNNLSIAKTGNVQ